MVRERWRIRESRETDDSEIQTPNHKEIEFDEFVSKISKEIKQLEQGEKNPTTLEESVEGKTVDERVKEIITRIRIEEALDSFRRESEDSEGQDKTHGSPEIHLDGILEKQKNDSMIEEETTSELCIQKTMASIQREITIPKTGIDMEGLDEDPKEIYQELELDSTDEREDIAVVEKHAQSKEIRLNDFTNRELRYAYELENVPPEVTIESLKEVDTLIEKYEDSLDERYVERTYEQCKKYLAIHNDWSKTQLELAKEHGISQSLVGMWRGEYEHGLIRTLRSLEEDFIVKNWAEKQDLEVLSEITKEYRMQLTEMDLEPLRQDFSEVKMIEPSVVREVFGEIDENQIEHTLFVKGFEKMLKKGQGDERIFYSDLTTIYSLDEIRKMENSLLEKKRSIESELTRSLALESVEKTVKVASVEGRLYMWMQDISKNDMLNAWAGQYFYLKDSRELTRLANGTLEKLGFLPEKKKSIEHYNMIMDQILSDGDSQKLRNSRHMNDTRVQGEVLRFHMDVMGLDTGYLNDRIEKITGINGQGGIRNPRFIEGKQLEYLRARLMATANSDFHLRSDGRGEYYEESWERVQIFKQNLSELGEVNVTVVERKGDYKANITSIIGTAMIFWGCPFGDKSIRNEGLPQDFMELSADVHQKYGEDLIVQDGAVTKNGYVTWVRHIAIHAGNKTDEYGFQSSISSREVDLIKSKGEYDEYMDRYVIGYGYLENLKKSRDFGIGEAARYLLEVVDDNPSNMIETESDIFRSQGISIGTKATTVKYYLKTGKVSVAWVAKTETIVDTIKWLKAIPPNDVVKREKAYDFLKARGEQPSWKRENPRRVGRSEQ